MAGMLSAAKDILFAVEEIKRLNENARKLRTDLDAANARIVLLEQANAMRELEFTHLTERTRTAAEAGVQIGIARMERDVQAKLVELDLRLKAVESAGTPSARPRLPRS